MTDAPQDAEAERLRKWREDRAAVAEEQKQERLKQAEEERQKRLAQAELDKEERVRQAQMAREEAAAAEAARQRAEAEERLPKMADLEAVRDDMFAYSRRQRARLIFQAMVFVVLPTILFTAYAATIAVPLYETRSVLVVSKAGQDNDEGLGGVLGAAAGPSNLHESFMAHEYIQSQALLDVLERDLQLVTTLSGRQMDAVQRLRNIGLFRVTKRDQFSRFVKSSINIQTGLLTLYVRMPEPDLAFEVSNTVIRNVAGQINALSSDLFEERIQQAEASVAETRQALIDRQADLTRLQIESGEANPQARIEGVFRTIAELESELQALRSEIDRARVSGQSENFQTLRLLDLEQTLLARIDAQRDRLVQTGPSGVRPLNTVLAEYELALLQVRIAEQALTTTLTSLATAREESALGRSQFQVVVPPNRATQAKFPNVALTALITFLSALGLFTVFKLLVPRRMG